MRRAWDKNAIVVCMVLSVLMGVAFGVALGAIGNQDQIAGILDAQRKERAAIVRAHRAEKKYLRNQLEELNATVARQSDQLAMCSSKAADGAKAAIQLIDKQTPKAGAK